MGSNNSLLAVLFIIVNHIEQCNIVEHESGVTMLNNIIDNIKQCGQQNSVQSCFINISTSCSFSAVYVNFNFTINFLHVSLYVLYLL